MPLPSGAEPPALGLGTPPVPGAVPGGTEALAGGTCTARGAGGGACARMCPQPTAAANARPMAPSIHPRRPLTASTFPEQHCLYLRPLPHGQGSLRPTLALMAPPDTSSAGPGHASPSAKCSRSPVSKSRSGRSTRTPAKGRDDGSSSHLARATCNLPAGYRACAVPATSQSPSIRLPRARFWAANATAWRSRWPRDERQGRRSARYGGRSALRSAA